MIYRKNADGVWFWGYSVTWQNPSNDPYFKKAQLTVQVVNDAGTPDPSNPLEKPVFDNGIPGAVVSVASDVNWTLPAADYPYRRYRFRLRVENSLGVSVLETSCWPGGAEYGDLVPEVQTGALEGARLKALSVGTAAIDNLAVTDAKIASLAVDKLLAGTISVAVSLTSATIVVTSGTVTLNLDAIDFLKVTDSGTPASYSQVTAVGVTSASTVNSAFASIGTTGPYNTLGVLALQDHTGVKLLIRSAVASTATAGSASLPANPAGFLDAYWNSVAIRIPYYLA